jgi:hypothetical protein
MANNYSKADAREDLARIFPAGSTVVTVNKGYNGDNAYVGVLQVKPGQAPWDVSRIVARALGYRYSRNRHAVIMGGGGYDKAGHVAYGIARSLHDDGYALKHTAA